jgi:hypothetical protein
LFLFFGALKPVLPFFFAHIDRTRTLVLVIFGQTAKEKECEGEKRETASHSCTNSKDKRALNRFFVQENQHRHMHTFYLSLLLHMNMTVT